MKPVPESRSFRYCAQTHIHSALFPLSFASNKPFFFPSFVPIHACVSRHRVATIHQSLPKSAKKQPTHVGKTIKVPATKRAQTAIRNYKRPTHVGTIKIRATKHAQTAIGTCRPRRTSSYTVHTSCVGRVSKQRSTVCPGEEAVIQTRNQRMCVFMCDFRRSTVSSLHRSLQMSPADERQFSKELRACIYRRIYVCICVYVCNLLLGMCACIVTGQKTGIQPKVFRHAPNSMWL